MLLHLCMKMNTRYIFVPELVCGSVNSVTFSSISTVGDDRTAVIGRNTAIRTPPSSFFIRMAMRVSRARWYSFLRRVFHYQNGSVRSDLGSNPLNSGTWMVMELYALLFQITVISYTLSVSNEERPVWPMWVWVWVVGYDIGCVFSLVLLGWRYRVVSFVEENGLSPDSSELHRSSEDLRSWTLMNKFRTCMELFFAIWFVMGNVWVFDSRFGSFNRAPKLHLLCIFLLAWNALTYSFPFILFVLLCCCVPLFSTLLGYNMNMGSVDRGASDEQLSELPSWKYKDVGNDLELGNSAIKNENQECCICLSKYRDREEIRQLPCSHIFHLNCVDQWLRIISCCPLCKQELKR